MILMAFFSDQGIPKTGLSPTIDVWKDDATHVITAQAMTEIAGGFYKYDFAAYDEAVNYCISADGGAGLQDNDRYVLTTNALGDLEERLTFLKDIEGGRWKIVANQMIFYKSDNITEVARFNLFNEAGVAAMKNLYERNRV